MINIYQAVLYTDYGTEVQINQIDPNDLENYPKLTLYIYLINGTEYGDIDFVLYFGKTGKLFAGFQLVSSSNYFFYINDKIS